MDFKDLRIEEGNYLVWNEYAIHDSEIGVVVGGWEEFETFEELEHFVKTEGINRALLSMYHFGSLSYDADVHERIKYLYNHLDKKERKNIKKIETFVKSRAKDFIELNSTLYRVMTVLKSNKNQAFNLSIFDSIYTAVALVNEHYIRNFGDHDENNLAYKDIEKAFKLDEA